MESILLKIYDQIKSGNFRISQHAHQEMVEENISLDELREAISKAKILENYPEHRRGACCLLNGNTQFNRPIHIVCTTALPTLIIITVYEPKAPYWLSPTQRR